MGRRGWHLKLRQSALRRKEMTMVKESDTPRTDVFVSKLNAFELRRDDFVSDRAMMIYAAQLRELMEAWAQYARDLESDLNNSTPVEWKGEAGVDR